MAQDVTPVTHGNDVMPPVTGITDPALVPLAKVLQAAGFVERVYRELYEEKCHPDRPALLRAVKYLVKTVRDAQASTE